MILNKVHFYTGKIIDNYIYASQSFYNGLIRIDLNTSKAKYIAEFPEEKTVSTVLHRFSYKYGRKIFFVPCDANNVAVYDETTGLIKSILIDDYDVRKNKQSVFCVNDNRIWIIPVSGNGKTIIINMDDYKVEVLGQGEAPFEGSTIVNIWQEDNKVYFVKSGSNIVVEYNLESGKVKENNSAISNLYSLSKGREELWLLKQKNETLCCIRDGKEYVYPINETNRGGMFVNVIDYKQGVYAIPYKLEDFLVKKVGSDWFDNVDIHSLGIHKLYSYPGAFSYDLIETESMWILPPYNIDKMIMINKEDGHINTRELIFEEPIEIDNADLKSSIIGGMLKEDMPINLRTYIEII